MLDVYIKIWIFWRKPGFLWILRAFISLCFSQLVFKVLAGKTRNCHIHTILTGGHTAPMRPKQHLYHLIEVCPVQFAPIDVRVARRLPAATFRTLACQVAAIDEAVMPPKPKPNVEDATGPATKPPQPHPRAKALNFHRFGLLTVGLAHLKHLFYIWNNSKARI